MGVYKVGDIVKLRDDLELRTYFEDYFLTSLQDEVELIESPCEDEHIVGADKTIEPSKIEELIADETDLDWLGIHSKTILSNITDKLNEVIRKINKE